MTEVKKPAFAVAVLVAAGLGGFGLGLHPDDASVPPSEAEAEAEEAGREPNVPSLHEFCGGEEVEPSEDCINSYEALYREILTEEALFEGAEPN